MTDYRQIAASLYDGGWRSADIAEMVEEYGLTEEEARTICEILADFEED